MKRLLFTLMGCLWAMQAGAVNRLSGAAARHPEAAASKMAKIRACSGAYQADPEPEDAFAFFSYEIYDERYCGQAFLL